MATRKLTSHHHLHHHDHRPKFLYLGGAAVGDQRINPIDSHDDSNGGLEMNESDIWNTNGQEDHQEPEKSVPRKPASRKPLKLHRKLPMTGKSLPVNVPDWSKILRDEYNHGRRENDYEFDDDDDGGGGGDGGDEWLPPHEYLARTRIASFSVHEGIGRTLKGRDLSRLRNAIWKQTGFGED